VALLFQIVLIVHVVTAMMWFGGSMFMPRRMRNVIGAGTQGRAQFEQLAREGKVLGISSIITFLTGVGLIMLQGGFAEAAPRFHVATSLSLVWVLVGWLVTRSAGLAAGKAVVGGDTPGAEKHGKRFTLGMGIQHLLFTIVLIYMLWRMG
jgi:uncharacterized membrane protein